MDIENKGVETQKEKEKKPQELERKFLVVTLPPDIESYPCDEIEQGYIEITDEVERRVRRKGQKYFYTEKIGTGAVRQESEHEISEDEFNNYWVQTEGRRVSKTRYKIPYRDKYAIETDIYHDQLDGLVTAEIEFANEQEMAEFDPPAWLGEDVTLDKGYKNQTLATKDIPESYGTR